jgi:undecaprenyl diphosphate synthase
MKNNQLIQCVGFIMDGNRRWAKERGLPTLEGHARGYENLKELMRVVHKAGIPHMVCYAFSTENWKRTEEEVGYLMKLLHHALMELPELIAKEGKRINIRVIGERQVLSKDLQEVIANVESKNYADPELTVWVALSYGGRLEIVDAVNRAVTQGVSVTEESFEKLLWTHGMPDPDIIIRTSGEKRISNFLLWQSAYSEFFFTDTLWPDFGETEFQSILEDYANRERRKGS